MCRLEIMKDNNYKTDYINRYNVREKEFCSIFLSLKEWLQDKVKISKLIVYRDGFKTSLLNIKTSYRLRTECIIFQVDVYTITKAVIFPI